MCPITNFAKGRFSEIQSRVSNSLLELIQTLYFVQQSPSHDDARIVPHDRYTLQLLFK